VNGPRPRTDESVPRAAWGLLAFLVALNVLNFVDRVLITSLAPLLIADLGLTRAEIGLLAGFGFVVFYTVVGLFLGVAADRWRRLPLIAAGLTLWSAMTALSGFARNFLHLAAPRLLVGAGEATLTPAALSLLGDVFPRRRLALASSLYYTGIPLGTALSLVASSYLAPRYGWRACFFLLGGVGLLAAFGLLAFREPARRHAAISAAPLPLGQVAREAAAALCDRPALALTLLGGALLCYGSASAMHVVTWLVEERGFDYPRAAFQAGIVAVLAGLAGNVAGGAFADRCARRRSNGHLWSLIPMTAFFAPFGLAFFTLAPGTTAFYLCWFVTVAGHSAWFGTLFATVQELAPGQARATTVAVALLAVNLLGVGPGPLVTGILGDRYGLTAGLIASVGVAALALVPLTIAARARLDPEPRSPVA
jgi:predicted MFS family arabinose efflux permease